MSEERILGPGQKCAYSIEQKQGLPSAVKDCQKAYHEEIVALKC